MAANARPALSPLWTLPIRLASIFSVFVYVHVAYRIRSWGGLPHRRGPTLVIANHQHDLDDMAIVADLSVRGPLRDPIYSLSSRRQFEPGFFAVRLSWLRLPWMRLPWLPIAWLRCFLYRYNASGLFYALGLRPIENQLSARPLTNLAWELHAHFGDMYVADALTETACARLPITHHTRVSEVFEESAYEWFSYNVKLSEVREPYRSEMMVGLRTQTEADLRCAEELMRNGATMYLTPEGRHSLDGSLGRLRSAFTRLAPLSAVYLAALSYDPLLGRRLSLLYRVLPLRHVEKAQDELRAARPVTVSQLLGEFLAGCGGPFAGERAVEAVCRRLEALPESLFVDPELRRRPEHVVRAALETMVRLNVLHTAHGEYVVDVTPVHPNFPEVRDIVAYQARFLHETLDADARLNGHDSSGAHGRGMPEPRGTAPA